MGKLDVDIGKDAPLIIFIGYLFDNDTHLLSDPKYAAGGGSHAEAIQMCDRNRSLHFRPESN